MSKKGNDKAFVYASIVAICAMKMGDTDSLLPALDLAFDEYESLGPKKVDKLRKELRNAIVTEA